MLYIVITACSILISEPVEAFSPKGQAAHCREYQLQFDSQEQAYGEKDNQIVIPKTELAELQACRGISGQFEISKFLSNKPDLKVNKYLCTIKAPPIPG